MNAKEEFLELVKLSCDDLVCVDITYLHNGFDNSQEITLPVGYTQEQYDAFLETLNFNYDNGFGTQHMFGTVWFSNNGWAERREYDGAEWWQYCYVPVIPDYLKEEAK